ncbi:MAG: geranylgeranyl pyrophosphate synthase [Candidatus Azotimanducaceae bacterium]|jgi:geranylgeranyl pyrophosphate synthase|tara:strand:+ start:368 stop:1249 length:882 start_codon:yes stop_codon:yes gene_type:complete
MLNDLASLLLQIEESLKQHLPTNSQIAQPMLEAMNYAVMGGGKRLRPMLVCAGSEAFGGDYKSALPAGCAFEFIHAYSLIHDDLPAMDDDDLRHGRASTHVAFGEANAILAGDSLHSLAFQSISEAANISPTSKLRIINLLSKAAGWHGMSGGQCLDIEAEGKLLTLAELKMLHAAKTGALIKSALEVGALCAEADTTSTAYKAISEFGAKIGLAFQIVDDILDVTQTSETLGKPAGSDEGLNKNTFPRLLGLDESKNKAEDLLQEAMALLEQNNLKTPLLEALANRAVHRTF